MILVTTAGKVGSETARLLRERDEAVRVLVRDPAKATARALAEAGAEIAPGDLGVPASVDEAMRGVSGVVLVSPAVPAQELNVVASAASAGAGHVVKATSKAAADSPIARRRWQAEIEAGLAAAGIPHTLLRSNAYMQNVLALAPAIAATSSFGSSAGQRRVCGATGDGPPVGQVPPLHRLVPEGHVGGSASSVAVRCRFHTCRPVYRGFSRIVVTEPACLPAPPRPGSGRRFSGPRRSQRLVQAVIVQGTRARQIPGHSRSRDYGDLLLANTDGSQPFGNPD
jgi:hypothetical protein